MTANRDIPLPAHIIDPHPGGQMNRPASGFVPGGPVGEMHAELNARLNAAEYERWLLPPQARDGLERIVHALSLAAGAVAMISGVSFIWLFA